MSRVLKNTDFLRFRLRVLRLPPRIRHPVGIRALHHSPHRRLPVVGTPYATQESASLVLV